jgi:two-component system, chemotaxis family, chemotaxis protein CheY
MKKILVVDDSMFMRKLLKDILSKDYIVVEACSGASAREVFHKENPDLVLLDIVMPEGDSEGIHVLQDIRRTDPNVNVIMISAVGQDAFKEDCHKLGVTNYIVKPFDEKKVLDTVAKCAA